MYAYILFLVVVGLAISFCGQIEGAPERGGQKTLVNEEPEKQPSTQAEGIAIASANVLLKMLHQEEPEKQPMIQDETMADAPTALPKMVQEELEQKRKKETAGSNGQGSKDEGIQGAKDSLVGTPKIERTEIQEEIAIDEKVKEKGSPPKPKKEQTEIQEEIAIDEKVKGKGLPPKPKKEQTEIQEEIAIDEKVKGKGLPPKPKKEQTEIQEEGLSEDEIKLELKRILSRSSTLSRSSSRTYTDAELEAWKGAFEIYDIDKNGEISAEELEKTLRRLGEFDGSKEDIKRMIAGVDRDNSGTVNFSEFLEMMAKKSDDELGELRMIFNVYDKNGDGYISADELKSLDLDDDDKIDALIAAVDLNGDGKIDFFEFQTLLMRIQASYG